MYRKQLPPKSCDKEKAAKSASNEGRHLTVFTIRAGQNTLMKNNLNFRLTLRYGRIFHLTHSCNIFCSIDSLMKSIFFLCVSPYCDCKNKEIFCEKIHVYMEPMELTNVN